MRATGINCRICDLPRLVLSTVVVGVMIVSPITAASDNSIWTDREICRAAVKTYFFLDSEPADAANSGQFSGFRSTSGYIYGCRINDDKVEFRWLNASEEIMRSNSTEYHVLDNVLTIQTDMKTESFSLK